MNDDINVPTSRKIDQFEQSWYAEFAIRRLPTLSLENHAKKIGETILHEQQNLRNWAQLFWQAYKVWQILSCKPEPEGILSGN